MLEVKGSLWQKGFEIVENVFSEKEVDDILKLLEFTKTETKFGVREFLFRNPNVSKKVLSKKLITLVKSISSNYNASIKSIYFDKPPSANWIVNWHQDLTINLSNRLEVSGFKNWRLSNERVVVQPNREILESIITIRIHLDDCTKENGALRVIENSHENGVIEIKEWMKTKEGKESICEVKKGGVLIMKPLTLHSSRRSENQKNRRVIHVEFIDMELPAGLRWKECILF